MVEMITENARIYIEENIGRTVSLEINERIIPELIELINSKADKIYLTLVLLDEGEIAKYVILRAADEKEEIARFSGRYRYNDSLRDCYQY